MNKEQWLEARKQGIGGSDIAVILGLSKFKTPFELWQDKTGRAQQQFSEAQAERMHWGNVLEDIVAKHYADQNDCKIQRVNQILSLPNHPIALANIDRAVVLDGSRARYEDGKLKGAERILEVKTANALAKSSDSWGIAGTDEVPEAYWLQVMWYLGITGLEIADIAVLFGGQSYVQYQVQYEASIFNQMLERAESWWQTHIVNDMPPEPTNEHEAKLRWKATTGKTLEVDAQAKARIDELKQIKAQLKELEDKEQAIRDELMPLFADAEIIEHNGLKLATYKQNKPSLRTDWKKACEGLNPSPDYLEQFSKLTDGARVLRLA